MCTFSNCIYVDANLDASDNLIPEMLTSQRQIKVPSGTVFVTLKSVPNKLFYIQKKLNMINR